MLRLEAAVNRIEDVVDIQTLSTSSATVNSPQNTSSPLNGTKDSRALAGQISDVPQSVKDFETLSTQSLKKFLDCSALIGGLVMTQAEAVRHAFLAQQEIISTAAQAVKPAQDSSEYATFLQPLQLALQQILAIKDSNRPSPLFNHLSTVADGMTAAGWVSVSPTPGPFVSEMRDSAQFYANRVIKEYKEKDTKHIEWIRTFLGLLTDLQAYIKEYHTTGLTWGLGGESLKTVLETRTLISSSEAAGAQVHSDSTSTDSIAPP